MKKLLLLILVLLTFTISTSCFGCSKVEDLDTVNYSKYLNFTYTVESLDGKYIYNYTFTSTNDKYVFKNVEFGISRPTITVTNGNTLPSDGNLSGSFVDSKLEDIRIIKISGSVYK